MNAIKELKNRIFELEEVVTGLKKELLKAKTEASNWSQAAMMATQQKIESLDRLVDLEAIVHKISLHLGLNKKGQKPKHFALGNKCKVIGEKHAAYGRITQLVAINYADQVATGLVNNKQYDFSFDDIETI